MAEIAKLLGTPFMPWQRQVADVALELLPDGSFAYREVTCTVPRQQGKTTEVLAVEVWRGNAYARIRKRRQRIMYSAQTGKDGRQKLLDDQVPILLDSPLAALLDSRRANGGIRRESGGEGIDFKGGSRIDVMAGTQEAGHGKTLDLAMIDEAFADVDNHREQAMGPAMITRRDAQTWITSTAGWEASTFLNNKMDAGRAAVADGVDRGIAYFEWSADEAAAFDDPDTWWSCMPALGITIDVEDVRTELRKMLADPNEGEAGFRRAYLNQRTSAQRPIIPKEVWDAVNVTTPANREGVVLGIDCNPERDFGSIVACDESRHAEVVDHREGVTWMIDRLEELKAKYNVRVVIDSKGPAASLSPEIRAKGVQVTEYSSQEMAQATARLYDAIADRQIKVCRNAALDQAVAGARKRPSGDVWYWGRANAHVDVSPLVALTIAYDLAVANARTTKIWAQWR